MKRVKIISILIIFISVFSVTAKSKADSSVTIEQNITEDTKESKKAKKTKKSKKDKKAEETQDNTQIIEEENKPRKLTRAEKKAIQEAEKKATFTKRNIKKQFGNIGFVVKGSLGSFNLYAIDKKGNQIPVLAGYEEFTTSFMSLLIGEREYRLNNKVGVITGTRETDNGVQLVYSIQDKALVFVDFKCIKVSEDYGENVLKVDITIENTSKNPNTYGLKNVYDTYLAEQEGTHFRSSQKLVIDSELQTRLVDSVKWIYSGNKNAGVQFLLSGADIKTPDVLSLSNKDVLSLPSWIPDLIPNRPFDSVFSYNNSAIGLNWENIKIKPKEKKTITYYMVFTTDNENLLGDVFLEEFEKKNKKSNVKNGVVIYSDKENINSSYENNESVLDYENFRKLDNNVINENDVSSSVVESNENDNTNKTEQLTENSEQSFNVVNVVPNIPSSKLNYEYVQILLDKINNLEAEGSKVDREELLKLNSELDTIMKVLGQ